MTITLAMMWKINEETKKKKKTTNSLNMCDRFT